ncbi:MAG: aldehyde dehydrogenase family protein, partial [Gammaproteobacteria bacterium]|nr:aldehyde dehydrogenase family protein [Gammaproteobacteria bacterium]
MQETKLKKISIPQQIGHFINGKHVSYKYRALDVINPATGEAVRQVALASEATVEQVIAVAQQAFPAWRDTPVAKRVRVMFRFKQLLEDYADQVVELITEEHGKTLDDARGEFLRGVEVV